MPELTLQEKDVCLERARDVAAMLRANSITEIRLTSWDANYGEEAEESLTITDQNNREVFCAHGTSLDPENFYTLRIRPTIMSGRGNEGNPIKPHSAYFWN